MYIIFPIIHCLLSLHAVCCSLSSHWSFQQPLQWNLLWKQPRIWDWVQESGQLYPYQQVYHQGLPDCPLIFPAAPLPIFLQIWPGCWPLRAGTCSLTHTHMHRSTLQKCPLHFHIIELLRVVNLAQLCVLTCALSFFGSWVCLRELLQLYAACTEPVTLVVLVLRPFVSIKSPR